MRDWNSLQPLKTHSTILGIVALLLLSILIFTPSKVFNSNFINSTEGEKNITFTVIAENGLTIRNKPNKKGKPLDVAPYNSIVLIIKKDVSLDSINGQSGYWHEVKYNENVGYAFGLYLK